MHFLVVFYQHEDNDSGLEDLLLFASSLLNAKSVQTYGSGTP